MASAFAHDASRSMRERAAILRNLYGCYFLSGAVGLVYQVLWLRKLLLVFGSTLHAVSTVLTVFFAGLALGSWLFGRLIDRYEREGLRWYALLELGVGLFAFLTLPLFDLVQHLYIPLYRASGFSSTMLVGASFACSALVLLIPTTLLGGTFPVLSRFVIRSDAERGATVAGLYASNTAGAMAGTLFVYFVALPFLGLFRSVLCAGVLNLGIGLLCLAFDRRLADGELASSAGPSGRRAADGRDASANSVRWVLLTFGLSGFSAMAYEVAWTRALSLVLGSSVYAFCIMLTTFLGGMAIGSAWAKGHLSRVPATIQRVIQIEGLLGLYGLLSIVLFNQLPGWFVALWPLAGASFGGLSRIQWGLSGLAMLLPTILMGALFPIASDLIMRRAASFGRRLGTAYAVNTIGGIAGSFLTGFALIPIVGLPWALVAASVVNLAAATVLYVGFGRALNPGWRAAWSGVVLTGTIALAALVVVPAWQQQVFAAGVYLDPESFHRQKSLREALAGTKLLYYRDSLNATVSVHQLGENLFLKIGGKTDASTDVDMGTQVLSAHIPLLLHPHPERVLVIGLGSGVTLGTAARYPVSVLHCAEIDPAVIDGARFFKAYNYDIHADPRATIFPVDGRNFLLSTQGSYDVIVSEPSNPWMAGVAYLFTREFYQLVKQRLASGGVMCQWLQLYRMFPSDVKLLLKTFHEAFPYVSVWSSIPGDVLLVGSMTPHQFDLRQLAGRMSAAPIRDSLRAISVTGPDTLLALYGFGTHELEQLTADVRWVHTDDQPWVEFSAPKALYVSRTFEENYAGLERFKRSPGAIAPGYDEAGRDAASYRALGALWKFRGEREKARGAFERAAAVDPTSPETQVELAALHLADHNDLRALEVLTQVLAASPATASAHWWLARVYRQQHKLEEASRSYLQAARLRTPNGSQAEEIGGCLASHRHRELAAEFYRSSISQGGGSRAPTLLAYAKLLRELHASSAAEEVLRFGAARFPQDAAFALALGDVLIEQGRWMDAKPHFERALGLRRHSPEAYEGLGRVALSQGQRQRAVQYFLDELTYDPYNLEASKWLRQAEAREPSSQTTLGR